MEKKSFLEIKVVKIVEKHLKFEIDVRKRTSIKNAYSKK